MEENILFITNQIVYPPTNGGKKITLSMIMSLYNSGSEITVLSFDIVGEDRKPSIKFFNDQGIPYEIVQTKKFERRKNYFTYITDYFLGLFSLLPRYVQNRLDNNINEKIKQIIHDRNISKIYLDSIWLSDNVDDTYNNLIWVIEHNIEYIFSIELAKTEKNLIKKLLFLLESIKIYFHEKKNLTRFPHIIFLSSYDREFAIKKFGINPDKCIINDNKLFLEYSIEHKGDENYILFTGSLLFLPNLEGINWFLDYCFPIILAHYPDLTLKITGKYNEKIKNAILKKCNNVVFTNLVPDDMMKDLLTHTRCVISPILSGSGIKIKNIEAMQLGVPIVMTEFSARGIPKTNNDKSKFCETNNPSEFTMKLLELLNKYQF